MSEGVGSIVLCRDDYCKEWATREFAVSDYDSGFYCDKHEPERPKPFNLICEECDEEANHLIQGEHGTYLCHHCWEERDEHQQR